jgi:hypothetical protein
MALDWSAAEVCFCVIQGFYRYYIHAMVGSEAFGVATGLASHKKWNFPQLFFGFRAP